MSPTLPGLSRLKERHKAWLLIDEAHSIGVLGNEGRGLWEHAGVDPQQIDLIIGTLSKTLVSCGGFVAGKQAGDQLVALHAARICL